MVLIKKKGSFTDIFLCNLFKSMNVEEIVLEMQRKGRERDVIVFLPHLLPFHNLSS